jgi:hypothetical protein
MIPNAGRKISTDKSNNFLRIGHEFGILLLSTVASFFLDFLAGFDVTGQLLCRESVHA